MTALKMLFSVLGVAAFAVALWMWTEIIFAMGG